MGIVPTYKGEEEEEDLFVFNDTIEDLGTWASRLWHFEPLITQRDT